MNKKVLGFALVIAVAMLTFPIFSVYAKNNPKFMEVSGQIIVLGGATFEFRPAGNSDNTKLTITGNSLMWTGSFEDSISIANGHWMLHKESANAWNIHTMQAAFDGKSGTLTIITSGRSWRIISGTGDFVNCHGQGKVATIVSPVVFSYEGTIHFAP